MTPEEKEEFSVELSILEGLLGIGVKGETDASRNWGDYVLSFLLGLGDETQLEDGDITITIISGNAYLLIGGGFSLELNVSELGRILGLIPEKENACGTKK